VKPSTAWIAIVLLVVGVCGLLDAAGVVDWSQTIGLWWPLVITGWAVAEMASQRRVTLGGVVCSLIGIALLADVQAWTSDIVVWSTLAITVGAAILVAAGLRHGNGHDADAATPAG
jgi:hypothetical protein